MSFFATLNLVVVVLLLILPYNNVHGDEQQESCSKRCGVHNISHPFRLKDSPENCGDNRYILSCEDNDQLILYYGSFGKYYVQSINYNNFTIRLLDFNNLGHSNYSLQPHPLGLYNFTSTTINPRVLPYTVFDDYNIDLFNSMLYVTCPKHVQYSSGIYFDAACMNISNSYEQQKGNYIVFGDRSLLEFGLGDGCRIELMFLTSWPFEHGGNNIFCTDIRRMMFYGFELSWLNSLCKHGWYSEILDYNNQRRGCARLGNFLQTTSSTG
ncbi:uncharacterized protein [Medicago truncatula]|uniref:uncharacterized protein n=1 Tax=Medicago truncatula TaxID=3880 RepID=UPI0000F6F723|nr:uncharacterized protein LOC11429262 [Medicago truncatula]